MNAERGEGGAGGKGDAIPLLQFLKMPRPVGGVIHSDPLNFKG